jgi:hypothetical protein
MKNPAAVSRGSRIRLLFPFVQNRPKRMAAAF